jgi:hypothetical protein
MSLSAPWILRTGITDDVLYDIYASDRDDENPGELPLIYDRLRDWIDASPNLSICFRAKSVYGRGTVCIGVVIVLPLLRRYWEDLLVGKLKEPDIEALTMFPREDMEEPEVGLHVFHMERSEAFRTISKLNHFAEFALEDISLRANTRDWVVLGYSGRSSSKVTQPTVSGTEPKTDIDDSSDCHGGRETWFQAHGLPAYGIQRSFRHDLPVDNRKVKLGK